MAYQFKNASILLVEDNQPMLELIRSVVDTFGFGEIYAASNGRQGFEAFCQRQPDIVIADWMMQPVNGIMLAHLIRNDKRSPNPYTPIILMTGFSQKKRVIEARDSGITEFIVKPFKANDLYKRIQRIIETPRQFVEADNFFGPDRRHKKDESYQGPFRRQSEFEDIEQNAPDKSSDFEIDFIEGHKG